MPLGPVVVLGGVEVLCFPRQTESAALCVHSGHVCTKQTSFGLWFQTSSMFYKKCIISLVQT